MKKSLLITTAVLLFATPASAVRYDMLFSDSNDIVLVDFDPDLDALAARRSTRPGYTPLLELGFDSVGRLEGTIALDDLLTFPNARASSAINEPWTDIFGSITFGADGGVADWDISAYNVGVETHAWSYNQRGEPFALVADGPEWQQALLTEQFVGMPVHGAWYTEPFSVWYNVQPGNWDCRADGKPCDSVAPIPLPLSLPAFLLTLTASFWYAKRR